MYDLVSVSPPVLLPLVFVIQKKEPHKTIITPVKNDLRTSAKEEMRRKLFKWRQVLLLDS